MEEKNGSEKAVPVSKGWDFNKEEATVCSRTTTQERCFQSWLCSRVRELIMQVIQSHKGLLLGQTMLLNRRQCRKLPEYSKQPSHSPKRLLHGSDIKLIHMRLEKRWRHTINGKRIMWILIAGESTLYENQRHIWKHKLQRNFKEHYLLGIA